MGIPVIEQKRCTGCRECVSVCGANAIEIVDEKAKIDYEKCYGDTERCSACIEICPQGAIFEME
ncbi:Indolepyruvate oxidoreductase subunit IorA [ANME-1 cluster archaeon GoMg1]|nr:Indolepyruvate oxidoreductase subunit IorA [ANME-1 cluster archaeon GoMg1]